MTVKILVGNPYQLSRNFLLKFLDCSFRKLCVDITTIKCDRWRDATVGKGEEKKEGEREELREEVKVICREENSSLTDRKRFRLSDRNGD